MTSAAAPSPDTVRAMQAALRAQGPRADPVDVVRVHVAAVHTRDPALMAADYTAAARITRGSEVVLPQPYFAQAVQRLGKSVLVVRSLGLDPSWQAGQGSPRVRMQWELHGDKAQGTRGTDTFTVQDDRITDQQVRLVTADY
jgi:hypothetical protein